MDAQYRRNHNENLDAIRAMCLSMMEKYEYKGKCHVGTQKKRDDDHLPAGKRRGECFTENRAVWMAMMPKGAKLMMGECRSRLGEWRDFDEGKGMPIWHVWVEVDDMVYDRANGASILMPKEMFYMRFRVQRSAEYPKIWNHDTTRGTITVHLPAPRDVAMVKEIVEKQRTLGRRDYPDSE